MILLVLGVAALGASLAGAWWLWKQSGAGAVVRDGSPSWSPDGEVVFSSEENGIADLCIADRSGGNRRQLTFTPANESRPAVSPDGQWIVYQTDGDGNFEIYVMRTDGTATHRLTNDQGIDQAPSWSRDGRQLVFMSNRDNKDFDIYRMNADGTGVERLSTAGAHAFPQYSPDGGQLALHIQRDVYIMSLANTALRRMTHEPNNGLYPTWAPDGLRIAFMSSRNGRSEIFTARPDGSDAQVVVTMPNGDAVDPRWSPNGKYIAFVHVPESGVTRAPDATQQRIVFIVELATGRLSRVSR